MHRLLNILSLLGGLKEYVVLAVLSIVSITLLSLNDNPQIRVIRAYTIGAIGLFQSIVSVVPNIFELERENEILRQQNVILIDQVSRLREARLENDRLRSMLDFRERTPFQLLPADVVGKTLDLMRNTITLNVGENEGVKPSMPIVTETGLVGRVAATSARYAVGQLMVNRDFRASAKIQRSRVSGIVTWSGGEYLELRNITKTQDVAVGDSVVTSEYSNMFPSDVSIGVVSSVKEHEGGLFKEIQITPFVDFVRLEHVFVLLREPDAERQLLEKSLHR
jgi:rod shape-determining protein MreC